MAINSAKRQELNCCANGRIFLMNYSNDSLPLVSAIVVNYNQSHFALETLESIRTQTYPNVELIVVDDCSTDDSVRVISKWLTKHRADATFIRHQKNMGVCRTLNDGIAQAHGEYISETAADDVWLHDKIAQQVSLLEQLPKKVGVVYTEAYLIDARSQLLPEMWIKKN